jgi:uncharacterized protein (DUF2141 family)
MMIKKFFLLGLLLIAGVGRIFAEDISFRLEVQGVKWGGGTVYAAGYSVERANNQRGGGRNSGQNTEPDFSLVLNASAETVFGDLSVPEGEYFIWVYQDSNGNGKVDLNLFRIPKEPVGMINYTGGIPQAEQFTAHINRSTPRLIIRLHSL